MGLRRTTTIAVLSSVLAAVACMTLGGTYGSHYGQSVAVMVTRADGSKVAYPPTADTDAARGTALLTAWANIAAGDVIELGYGTFALGDNVLVENVGNTVLRGQGMYRTTITSTAIGSEKGPVWKPGDYSILEDLAITCIDTGTRYQFAAGVFKTLPIGQGGAAVPGNTPPVHATIRRCRLYGHDAAVRVSTNDDASVFEIFDSVLSSSQQTVWEGKASGSVNYNRIVYVYNCRTTVTETEYSGSWVIGLSTEGGIIRAYGGHVEATGTTLDTYAVESCYGGKLYVQGMTVASTGPVGQTWDVFGGGGEMWMAGCTVDAAKVADLHIDQASMCRITTKDPLDPDPPDPEEFPDRPLGQVNDVIMYNGNLYYCTRAASGVTPYADWTALTSN